MKRSTLFACLFCFISLSSAFAETPNVVLIISDDQAWADYDFMGHEHIRTPHLDRLAAESLTFTRGYVPSSLCRPSLATMITGLYPSQHKISGNDPAPLPRKTVPESRKAPAYQQLRHDLINHIDKVPTLPRLLATKGYRSHQSGKWWEGNYRRGGFTAGMTRGFPMPGGRHGDDGLTIGREGLEPIFEFIAESRREKKPFFVWYAPFLPHTPHNPPKRLLDQYRDKTDSLPVAKYWAMCEWFDETCGELLQHLDDEGLRDSTMIVYVTDNGWINRRDRSAYAPRSKRSPNEGGIRTPIMIRYPPSVSAKMDETTLVSSIDLAPTILAACGLQPTQEMPGINLLNEAQRSSRKEIQGEIFAHDVADVQDPSASLLYRWVIYGPWKLIQPADDQESPQLFHLLNDPHENQDLAPAQPALVRALAKKLK